MGAHASASLYPRISPVFSVIMLAFRQANSGKYPLWRAYMALQSKE
jgi:hypothetical protein